MTDYKPSIGMTIRQLVLVTDDRTDAMLMTYIKGQLPRAKSPNVLRQGCDDETANDIVIQVLR